MAYSYSRSITIDHTKCGSADSTNFPAVFVGTVATLATVANGGHVQSSSGYDIIFASDAAGASPLNFERVSWDATTGACEFWIKIPTVSHSTDTVIYIVYGNAAITTDQQNATATWPSQYKAVYHLGTNTAADSTGNSGSGSVSGTVTTVAGQVGSAQHCTGWGNGAIRIGGSKLSQLFNGSNTVLTIAGWFWNDDLTTTSKDSPIGTDGVASGSIFVVYCGHVSANNTLQLQYTSNGFSDRQRLASTAFTIPLSTWYHAVFVLDLGTPANSAVYANGAAVTSALAPIGTPPTVLATLPGNNPLLLAGYGGGDGWTGNLDEVHFSNSVPSAAWVLTEYNNQSSPSTFYALGTETGGATGGMLINPGMDGGMHPQMKGGING